MKYLLLAVVLLSSCLFGGIARAGDILFQITSGKQDLLAVVEVTVQEPEATHIRVLFNFPQSKIKNTQTTHIFNEETNPALHVGGFYLVSLKKEKDGFKNAYGMHQLSGRDYRTATFVEPMNGDLAALQWFMNSGGKDGSFFTMGDKTYVVRDGVERLIYPTYLGAGVPESFLAGFSLQDISPLYWGMAGVAVAMVLFLCFFFATQFPAKKWMIPLFIVDGVIAVAVILYVGWDPGRSSSRQGTSTKALTEAQAIQLVQTRYSDLKGYPADTLPAKQIRLHPARDGWYLAFLQSGSGRPLIAARCFYVGNDLRLEERGVFQSTAETALLVELDPGTCQASP